MLCKAIRANVSRMADTHAWADNAKRIWAQDECAPDAEQIEAAWLRLFGEEISEEIARKQALGHADFGDTFLWLQPNGYVFGVDYMGGFISKVDPEHLPAACKPSPRVQNPNTLTPDVASLTDTLIVSVTKRVQLEVPDGGSYTHKQLAGWVLGAVAEVLAPLLKEVAELREQAGK